MDDQIGCEEWRGVGDRLHRGIVGRDIDEPVLACTRKIREQQRQETVGGARERQRCGRLPDGGEDIGGGSRHGNGI